MKRLPLFLYTVFSMFLCFSTNTYTTETPHVPGELIVKLKPNVNEQTFIANYGYANLTIQESLCPELQMHAKTHITIEVFCNNLSSCFILH